MYIYMVYYIRVLRALVAGKWKHWDINLPETSSLSNSRGSDNHLAETKPLHTVRGATCLPTSW